MPQQAAVSVTNNFKNGLITEATGLNFPENACTAASNCIFNYSGSVSRRKGLDFEASYSTKTINRANNAIVYYIWKNVSGNGDITLHVVQVGATIYFWKAGTTNVSSGALASTVTLTSVSGAPTPELLEAQFCDGNGYLFVTHPYCEPMRVSYDSAGNTVSATNITIKIRDTEGATADPYDVDVRPTSTLAALNVNHNYNLLNQGWTTANLTTWDTGRADMPSNADVMWSFKNSSDAFDISTVANVMAGNTAAPKGHFILTLSNQDRNTASGLSGVAATTTSFYRPSTCTFFAGRVFYSGINYAKNNSSIYFTQIVERDEQYGFCYQSNDPTSEKTFDLLSTDGGVIRINEAGTIYKLVAIPSGLAVFAANGVWLITGSTGLGFAATDYTVQKVSTVTTLTASSFVDIAGVPAWWNAEGIYTLRQESGSTIVDSLTDFKIKSAYNQIPLNSKKNAKGYYNKISKVVQWLYRSTDTSTLTNTYEYDSVLNFDMRTGAFYTWTLPTSSNVKINGIGVADAIAGAVNLNPVVRGADSVIDGSGNTVITFSQAGTISSPDFKYLASYPNGGTYLFTFAEASNTSYLDWFKYDGIGTDYTSTFTTGYRLRGEGIRKFQPMYVQLYNATSTAIAYYFQALWDYANTGTGTGRWSTRQLRTTTDTNYSTSSHRLKVRGHGKTLQFKITSKTGSAFEIIGWSSLDTGNPKP